MLSLGPRLGDFEKADVLIDGKLIADVGPNLSAGDAEVVDCSGTIDPGVLHADFDSVVHKSSTIKLR